MEEVKRDLIQVAHAIARVETKIAAVETGVKEAKAVGDIKELDSLRAEKIQLLAEKNKLLDKENKLLDEKSALREQENKMQLLQRMFTTSSAVRARDTRVCSPVSSITERRFSTAPEFIALLERGGVKPDEHVLDTIARSFQLSMLMVSCFTFEQATHVLELAGAVLHSRTKAIAHSAGVVIDGPMLIDGVQSALFFYAFKDCVPHVLKVLTRGYHKVKAECQLWQELSGQDSLEGIYCVPVTLLELSGSHAVHLAGGGSDTTALRAGILMPRYACTLSNIPTPMDASWALRVLSRVSTSLRAVHAAGWLHGDVKPSNIFIDFAGDAWLGDYGSSCRISDTDSYTGGTPAFQCSDITVKEPARFDRACLSVSICSAIRALQPDHAKQDGWPLDLLHTTVVTLADGPLKTALEELLRMSADV